LLMILINMPLKIEFNDTNYNMCKRVSEELDKLYKSHNIIEEYKKIND